MSNLERWQQGNDRYLAAALAWLRLRLARLAEPASQPATSSEPPQRGFFRWPHSFAAALPPSPTASGGDPSDGDPSGGDPSGGDPSDEDIRQAQVAMWSAEEALEPASALTLIGERLGLSTFEREVLLLCAAMELDTRMAELCQAAHGQPYPTFALALRLFDDPAWDVLSPERPLRYWRLIDINQPAAQPLTTSSLRADERIVNALKGLTYLDDRIRPLLTPLEQAPSHYLPPSQQAVVDQAVSYMKHNHVHPCPILQLVGSNSDSMWLVAQQSARYLGLPLYTMSAENVPTQSADLDTLARLWQRESLLSPVALYLDAFELETSSAAHAALLRFVARSDGFLFLASREVWTDLNRTSYILDVAKPTTTEQRQLWHALLANEPGTYPDQLAAQFDLSLSALHRAAKAAFADLDLDAQPLQDRLWEACRDVSRPRLERLAQPIDVRRATWERLVLPEQALRLLQAIAEQVSQRGRVYDDWGFAADMNRGLGISALFAGASGTGKTMAAEVIAHALKLDLYRIDLSSVVSKYIGETEKNLRQLFDAAENGGAILFFDEADALFGKRSEVKDAHDRYANIEVNYLLQRMEAYGGLAILATNIKSALDPAFVRRLRFIVDFPFPGADDRERMWCKVFPSTTPTRNLDFAHLAKLNLTGADIHNAALNAAFLAAHRGVPVGMEEVFEAARDELRKLNRPINEAMFRWQPKEVNA